MKRIITGALTAALAIAIVLYLKTPFFAAVATVLVLLAAAEYAAAVKRIVISPMLRWALWLAVGVLAFADGVHSQTIALPLPDGLTAGDAWFAAAALVLGLAVSVGLAGRADMRERLAASALFTFGALWLGLFLVAAVNLHRINPVLLFWVLMVAALSDIGAYYGGRSFGRTPLAPLISPNKTIAGAVSGLAASVVTGVVVVTLWWGYEAVSPAIALTALLCGAAAQVGDLVASLLKRAAEVKDTGRLLPGHGGLLDRLDSILLAAPLLYLALKAGAFQSLAHSDDLARLIGTTP